MFRFYLFLGIEVDLDIHIIDDIASKLVIPWILFEDAKLVGNVELVDDDFNYLLAVLFEVEDELALFLFREKLLEPFATLG